jgi:hypothetical protein
MPKKKKPHRPSKHKARHHPRVMFDHEHDGHHARLRKHHHAGGAHKSTSHKPSGHRHAAEHRTKTGKKASRKHKPSALIQRLRAAETVARQQLRGFGRRHKQHQPEKLVTEQTLRNHMALKCVRRCSH